MPRTSLAPALRRHVVGFIGAGTMGQALIRALRRAGVQVRGFDIRPASEFGDFADMMIPEPEVFARDIDVMISVVRDQQQTLDLYFEDQAIFKQPIYPKICILASTLSPRFLTHLRGRLPEDVVFFEAPMSGAPVAAEEARLTFMLGADQATAAVYLPLFRAMGREIHALGGLGRGMTCKVLNNLVAAASVLTVRHALAGAAELGLDPELLRRVMSQSSGASWFGDNFHHIQWAAETYDPGNTIGILEKDVTAMLDALGGAGLPSFLEAVRDGLAQIPACPPLAGK